MNIPTLDEIKQRFPIGDYIEYQTGNGYFSTTIRGHDGSKHGISLDLGDRKFPIWNAVDYKRAESYHRPASIEQERLEVVAVPTFAQLILF